MKNSTPIYLDNAATTFPKPTSVIMAAYKCMKEYCGNPGRGSHKLALMASEKVFECRSRIGELFSAEPENVVFTLNTTYALNIAIKGVMRGGGHILIGNMEHNSVWRPVSRLKADSIAEHDVFDAYSLCSDTSEAMIISELDRHVRDDTKALVCAHTSNICSATLPIEAIGTYCRKRGIIFILDAAQSAGHANIDMKKMNIDILCAPGHKGLYGAQGCGVMILGDGITLDTLTEGGNGVDSLEASMTNENPERYETGTLCTPAIAALSEGIAEIKSFGIENIDAHEKKLWHRACDMLSSLRGVTVYAKDHPGSILLFNIDSLPSDRVGALLNEKGICVRTGFHCSSLGHKTLGTAENGAVRASFSMLNTERDVEALCRSVKDIIKEQ